MSAANYPDITPELVSHVARALAINVYGMPRDGWKTLPAHEKKSHRIIARRLLIAERRILAKK